MENENKKKSSVFDKIVTIILLLIILALAGITISDMLKPSEGTERLQAQDASEVVVNVSSAEATEKLFIQTTRFQGEVTSDDMNISVLPDASSGTVESVQVKRGDKISAGDVVAYINPSRPGAQYSTSPVISKVSGEVLSVNVMPGSTVTSTTAIITVMPEKTLYVSTNIPERYLSTVHIGLGGTVTSVAYPDRSYPVEVSYMAPVLNTTSRTLPIELNFTGEKDGIIEGLYVSVDLITEQIDNALIVPSTAVSSYGGNPIVYVINNGRAERRNVVTGSSNTTETVILSGLSAGEMVVTAGSVSDGTLVSIV